MTGPSLKVGTAGPEARGPGISVSRVRLTLTGPTHDTGNGNGDTMGKDDKDKYRYRISVSGTGIEEYYEFDDPLDEDEVAQIWYSDVQRQWGQRLAGKLKDNIEVEALWEPKDTTSE